MTRLCQPCFCNVAKNKASIGSQSPKSEVLQLSCYGTKNISSLIILLLSSQIQRAILQQSMTIMYLDNIIYYHRPPTPRSSSYGHTPPSLGRVWQNYTMEIAKLRSVGVHNRSYQNKGGDEIGGRQKSGNANFPLTQVGCIAYHLFTYFGRRSYSAEVSLPEPRLKGSVSFVLCFLVETRERDSTNS